MQLFALYSVRKFCLFAAFFCVQIQVSRAELAIKPGDIKGGRYEYSLTQADMKSGEPQTGKLPGWAWQPMGSKFFDDLHSFSNVRITASSWAYVWLKKGASSGEFVFRFDFGKAGYRATNMRLREVVRHEQDGPTYTDRTATHFESFYSLGEGGDWIGINASEPGKGYRGDRDYLSDTIRLDGAPSVVYYQVVIKGDRPLHGAYLKKGQPDAIEDRAGVLWNLTRKDQPDRFFRILFDVVPANAK